MTYYVGKWFAYFTSHLIFLIMCSLQYRIFNGRYVKAFLTAGHFGPISHV